MKKYIRRDTKKMNTKVTRTERFIQFGEGGFLRGFADWMIQKINDSTDFEGNVVVVQPIANGMCDMLTAQNCNYTHIIRGEEGVETGIINVISRCVNPYREFDEYLKLAEQPEMRFIISNTTEAGITFNDTDKDTDTPPASFPAKLISLNILSLAPSPRIRCILRILALSIPTKISYFSASARVSCTALLPSQAMP